MNPIPEHAKDVWLAGVFDGEGWIGLQKRVEKRKPNPSYYAKIVVVNTNVEFLQAIREVANCGSIYERSRAAQKDNWKTTFVWQVTHRVALSVLERVRPYLIIKRTQANTIIEFYQSLAPVRRGYHGWPVARDAQEIARHDEIFEEVKAMNRRGLIVEGQRSTGAVVLSQVIVEDGTC